MAPVPGLCSATGKEGGVFSTVLTWLVAATIATRSTYALYTSSAGGSTNKNPSYAQYGCPPPQHGSHQSGSNNSSKSHGGGKDYKNSTTYDGGSTILTTGSTGGGNQGGNPPSRASNNGSQCP